MNGLGTYEGNVVPRNVWIAVGVILAWSLGPVALTLTALPDLISGDINGRALRFPDFVSAFQPLLLTAGFVLIAEMIRRRKRRAWLGLIIIGAVGALVAVPLAVIDEFDPVFLAGALLYAGGLVVAALLPGVRRWCDE
ncbi:hypothetical protein [Catenuloplanes atrovinosus]|uniref:Membrane protein YeaQ/YmgE (Transglycosylase-associated protein family) n=1 Tax=Catenuloplanes atrovinosus TaxID=137266 RepID=A0AAE3YPN8_9ACTN|nr:hypothetical protein [Catenuloplanes atrovinosus]MDR7277385.1 putative membrane protein YeaQ/YmgE (transglycosylase-associated protein family) [Catenuloplanes atrovinosus]